MKTEVRSWLFERKSCGSGDGGGKERRGEGGLEFMGWLPFLEMIAEMGIRADTFFHPISLLILSHLLFLSLFALIIGIWHDVLELFGCQCF